MWRCGREGQTLPPGKELWRSLLPEWLTATPLPLHGLWDHSKAPGWLAAPQMCLPGPEALSQPVRGNHQFSTVETTAVQMQLASSALFLLPPIPVPLPLNTSWWLGIEKKLGKGSEDSRSLLRTTSLPEIRIYH